MQCLSRRVASHQDLPHRLLSRLITRHQGSPYRRPFRYYSRDVFERLKKQVSLMDMPLIIDAGCGTGESTIRLASKYPDCLVIGADKSARRLKRQGLVDNIAGKDNYLFVRTDLVDLWRQLKAVGWTIRKQLLLYPNPWPRARHIKRRWHAHPVFADMISLAQETEMRCNWPVYADEFGRAVFLVTGQPARTELFSPDKPLSPFERKYQNSGHRLYRCRIKL
ncbi:MAG: SAM-dependent methyltransferase [Gammaproteobacteria bacterium]|nr:SAM-dependent methyltransferase [Gammaproteobacteria bacterium]